MAEPTIAPQETPCSEGASFAARAPELVCFAPKQKPPGDSAEFLSVPGLPFSFCTKPRGFFPVLGTQSTHLTAIVSDGFAFKFLFCLVSTGTRVGNVELDVTLSFSS